MKKNILFIMHVPPPVHGQSVIGSYIKQSIGINSSFNCTYINLSTSITNESIGKNSLKKVFRIINIALKVLVCLFKNKYDLCYITPATRTPPFYKDFLIVLILKLFNLKILYHFHSKGVADSSNSKFNRAVYRFAFKNSRAIILSKLLYKDIELYFPVDNVDVCWYGIPTSSMSKNLPDRVSRTGPCRLLFVSNIVITKGIFVVLDACEILSKNGVDYECYVVGDWAEISPEDFDKKLAELQLSNNVHAHGKKYHDEKFRFFLNSDVFLFPTYYKNETFGLVNLEAMQFGLPVISTPVAGIPDIIIENETGFLVPTQDPQSLADKLMVLINDAELRNKLGMAGRERFQQNFTLEIFEKNIISILNKSAY